jgi:hypothetical protein
VTPEQKQRLENFAPGLLKGLDRIQWSAPPFDYAVSEIEAKGNGDAGFKIETQFLSLDRNDFVSEGSIGARNTDIVMEVFPHSIRVYSCSDPQHCGLLSGVTPQARVEKLLHDLHLVMEETIPRPRLLSGAAGVPPAPAG